MSGLEVLGSVSSILQVISFGIETVGLCKAIYDGTQGDDDAVDRSTRSMMLASVDISEHLKTSDMKKERVRDLAEVAGNCKTAAEKLKDETDKLRRKEAKKNPLKAAVVTIRSLLKRSTLDKLEKDLHSYQKTMESHILVDIYTKTDAMAQIKSEDFDNLHAAWQSLLVELASGKTDMQSLIKAQHVQTRTQIIQQLSLAEGAIKDGVKDSEQALKNHITKEAQITAANIYTDTQRRALVDSTKYSAINQRFNDIHDPQGTTYSWVVEKGRGTPLAQVKPNCKGPFQDSLASVWPDYLEWLQCEDQTWYWITGKPGSGKSTLFKFLVDHTATREALSMWRPDFRILKHFFWKASVGMKSSLKGMWCSLLHQILSSDETICDRVLATFPDAGRKAEPTDWSEKELRELFLQVLSEQTIPYAVFVDGLDEIADVDGARALLNALSSVQSSLDTRGKICVSSRAEQRFQEYLDLSFELKLHFLTLEDIAKFIIDRLRLAVSPDDPRQAKFVKTVRNHLLEKAQGVFVWLVLAIRSVNEGIDNGDSEEEIMGRAKQLPADINTLYEKMWKRLNGDNDTYKDKASVIFARMIVLRSYPTLIEMAFVLDLVPVLEVIEGTLILDLETIHEICHKAANIIKVRCAGFLQATGPERPVFAPTDTWKSFHDFREYNPIEDPLEATVSFIHRTAFDYLTTSEHGRSLTSFSSATRFQQGVVIARSFLADHFLHEHLTKPKQDFGASAFDEVAIFLERALGATETDSAQAAKDVVCALSKRATTRVTENPMCWTQERPMYSVALNFPHIGSLVVDLFRPIDLGWFFAWNIDHKIMRSRAEDEAKCDAESRGAHYTRGLLPLLITKAVESGFDDCPVPIKVRLPKRVFHSVTILERLILELVDEPFYGRLRPFTRRFDLYLRRDSIQVDVVCDLIESIMALKPRASQMHSILVASRWAKREFLYRPPHEVVKAIPFWERVRPVQASDDPLNLPDDFLSEIGQMLFLYEANLAYLISDICRIWAPLLRNHASLYLLRVLIDGDLQGPAPAARVLSVSAYTENREETLDNYESCEYAFALQLSPRADCFLLDNTGLWREHLSEDMWLRMSRYLTQLYTGGNSSSWSPPGYKKKTFGSFLRYYLVDYLCSTTLLYKSWDQLYSMFGRDGVTKDIGNYEPFTDTSSFRETWSGEDSC